MSRDPDEPVPTFASALREARVRAGLTQRELASRSGVGRRTIAALERGEVLAPQDATIDLLAASLGLDAAGHSRLLAAAGGPGRRMRAPGAAGAASRPRGERDRPLFGRDRDIAALEAALVPGALVVLTGPGGVGKSRLAFEAVSRAAAAGRPAHTVALETLDDAGAVLAAIATALDWPPNAATPAALASLLAPGAVLLLDDADRLHAAAPEIAALSAAAPQATVLVTSREPLGTDRETVLPVAPMPVDALRGASLPPEAELLANPAVALFLHHAGASDASADDAARIVAALDGLPLAIELAAAQARFLDPSALLLLLEATGAGLLARGRSGHDRDRDRQATMSAAIAWSADLLPEPARRLLAITGAFRGGFSLEALQGVLADLDERRLMAALPDLIRASLVHHGAGDRLSMLEPIRLFAAERLAIQPDARAVRLAHARWFARWAVRTGRAALGPDLDNALAAEAADRANARLALRNAMDDDAPDLAAAIVSGLFRLWEAATVHQPLAPLLDDLADRAGEIADPTLRAEVRYHAGYLAYLLGRLALAGDRIDALRAGDGVSRALGSILGTMSDNDTGEVTGEDLREALAALTVARHPLAWIPPLPLGYKAVSAGDPEAGLRLYADALAALEAAGDRFDQPPVLHLMGYTLTDVGRCAEARDVLRRDIALCRRHGFLMALLQAVNAFAEACGRDGDPELARAGARLLGAFEAAHRRTGTPELGYYQERNADTRARMAEILPAAEIARLEAEGAALTLDEAAALALATEG